MSEAPEPVLDLSELIGFYKEDGRRAVGEMRGALTQWTEVGSGGPAYQSLRRLSHQFRGSGRTYGLKKVTRVSKALEHVMQKIEKKMIPADDRAQQTVKMLVERLAAAFTD